MFDAATAEEPISKRQYKRLERQLWERLLTLQRTLRSDRSFAVMVDFAGVRGAGKGDMVNNLHKWMDTRAISTRAYAPPNAVESELPEYWRFWRDLPGRGHMGLYLSGRYSVPLQDRVYRRVGALPFRRALKRIRQYERTLTDDGALVLKFWMHLDREAQEQRMKTLEGDALERWRVSELDWRNWHHYDRFLDVAGEMISNTDTASAPWHIVNGEDPYRRSLRVGEILADAMEQQLKASQADSKAGTGDRKRPRRSKPKAGALDALDMSAAVSKAEYKKRLRSARSRLNELHRRAHEQGISTVLVFEGPDAAGKGGAIRRLIRALDARNYQVMQIGSPGSEALSRHYLWRFWHRLPAAGRITIFDRSWYGRVLVERVEDLATPEQWRRAYDEIKEFESQLIQHGMVLVKYWIHISKDEQLARFKSREERPHKRWKLTDEDWRNRKRWDDYEAAVQDMVRKTDTPEAPWTLVPGNSKPYARLEVMKTMADALAARLKMTGALAKGG